MTRLAHTIFLFTAIDLAYGHPHINRHVHLHHHSERKPAAAPQVVDTAYQYELNGQSISAQEVQEGIANGTLQYANGVPQVIDKVSPSFAVSTASASEPLVAPTTTSLSTSEESVSTTSLAPAAASPNDTPAAVSSVATSSPSATGLDMDFPDGEHDCSTFPSAYGAISLDYLGLGGWSGIQCPGSQSNAGFANIQTKTDGSTCSNGDFCSYACPAGYEKTQWPSAQGSTSQSVGGLSCKNGKLFLTNPGLSRKLCTTGNTVVPITIKNMMSEGASICRTDYPGTESETIPLDAQPGTASNLTCPDASNYYQWTGRSTSAQYYVNPKGVSSQQACQWGAPNQPYGNYAPLNLGVGYSDGQAWLSIFPNTPTTNAQLDFSIEIFGDDGGYDNLSGRCKYENGQFHSGDDYQTVDPQGCTVGAKSGSATYVFSS